MNYVKVPVEATEEMQQAAADYLDECVRAYGLWQAMLAAAPKQGDPAEQCTKDGGQCGVGGYCDEHPAALLTDDEINYVLGQAGAMRERFKRSPGLSIAPFSDAGWAVIEKLCAQAKLANQFSAEPTAWTWEQASYYEGDLRGRDWRPMVGWQDPKWPQMTRNVMPHHARKGGE